MQKTSITKRFRILITFLCLLGIFIISFGVYTISTLNQELDRLQQATQLNEFAVRSEVSVKDMQSSMRAYLLNPDDDTFWKEKLAADIENDKIIKKMKALTQNLELKSIFDKQNIFDSEELNPRELKLSEMINNKKIDEAKKYYFKEVIPYQKKFEKIGQELALKTDQIAEYVILSSRKELSRLTWILVIIAIAGITIITFAVIISVKTILDALNVLVNTLSNGADAVASAAEEISATGIELSAAVTEQASSIQETASSAVEVSAMVKKNAENAKISEEVAREGEQAATSGKFVVGKMIQVMGEIEFANSEIMKQTINSNTEISEIVKVIAEIGIKTKVINDIVFQTKLLSFNASVEAARAGDNGKGFAVVAEEIGNLAKMSGTAAKEITELLDGSIKKVESIVANTQTKIASLIDNGQKKVDAGSKVAKKTNDVLDDIVHAVSNISARVKEIVIASKEQAQGVDEINKAVSQMDQVIHENASASHQSASAAASLAQQAAVLRAGVNDLVLLIGA
jgi:methyl-accepting chemotaxis protein